MKPALFPLFPLQVVLFPEMRLPLHVFEPRYKLMIGQCLEQQREFGVLLVREHGPASVGCSAALVEVVRRYDDGRMDILTGGRRRFRVLEWNEELDYLQGRVAFFEDTGPETLPGTTGQLLALFEEAVQLLRGETEESPVGREGGSLAFHVAARLPLELELKQQLLEMTSERERQNHLIDALEPWLAQLEHVQRVRSKAGGNGRGA